MCLASRATGMEPMIRVRKEGDHSFFRVFEAGATGIMVPHVRTIKGFPESRNTGMGGIRGITLLFPLMMVGVWDGLLFLRVSPFLRDSAPRNISYSE